MHALLAGLAAVLLAAAPALGQTPPPGPGETPACGPRVTVEYTDDDPDFFIIRNRSPAGWTLAAIAIDLAGSAGGVVFDTEEGGGGAGGAAPFYPHADAPVRLIAAVPAEDGGLAIALRFAEFTPGRDYSFSIDLDAIGHGAGRTWVLPADIAGARVAATFQGASGEPVKVDAVFNDRAIADSGAGGCV